jgi:hypothetical protein
MPSVSRSEFKKDRVAELRKMARLGKIRCATTGWYADYPDAENFMQLLYGPNKVEITMRASTCRHATSSMNRRARFGFPGRTRLFDKMTELVLAAPWRLSEHRLEDQLMQQWVKNYKPHPIRSQSWVYVDIDPALRK